MRTYSHTLRTLTVTSALATAAIVAACVAGPSDATSQATTPYCPTEDSCTVDYVNGAWHITEVTP